MLVITNNDKTEVLIESDYEKTEERNGAALQIVFSSFQSLYNAGHELLDYEVLVEDEDGHEYKVKQYAETGLGKEATATHIFYELNHVYKHDIHGGTKTFDDFATWLFTGTGWTYEGTIEGQQLITNFGENNVVALIQTLIDSFGCEFKILPNKKIKFAKVIGEDNDLQYRYKHNITDIKQSIDTTDVKTKIKGYGANGLEVEYISPLANDPRFGIREAEPIEDDSYTEEESMLAHLKNELTDTVELIVEVEVTEIDGDVGDYVHVIHEGLGLEIQTRILSKTTKRNYYDSKVVLGNTKPKTFVDVLVRQKIEIDENKREFRSKIVQTNELIELEVEAVNKSVANLSIKADAIESTVTSFSGQIDEQNQKMEDFSSRITQQANEISTEVNSYSARIEAQETQISQFSSQINQFSNEISSKVSYTDYNGDTITSIINQTASAVTISVDKINLNGAIIANGSITGSTDISVNNTVQIGNALYFGERSGSYDFIEVTGGNMTLNSFGKVNLDGYGADISGPVNIYGGLYVDGVQVTGSGGGYSTGGSYAETRTSGLGFGYSTGANRLYVSLYGVDYGYINLTPL